MNRVITEPIVALIGSLGVVLLASCKSAGDEEAEVKPIVAVETALVERASLPDRYELVGRLRPSPGGSALLTAPAAGLIKAIHGQTGTSVGVGTAVIELDTPDLTATAKQAASTAELAAREAARMDTLFRQGIVARKEVDRAHAELESAEAAKIGASRLAARSSVTTPLGGEIQRILVQRGERVDAGQLLAEVIDPSTLDVVASAPAEVLGRLKRGQPAVVAAAGDTIAATVEAVAPAVDSLTGVGDALIRIKNPRGRFRSGQSATALVTTGTARDVLAVPNAAVVLVGTSPTVFVITADSVAHARPVTLGVRAGTRVEVKGELAAGDRVVTLGAYGLADGSKVNPGGAPE